MDLISQLSPLIPVIILGFFFLSIAKGVIRVLVKIGLCAVGLYVFLQLLGQLPM